MKLNIALCITLFGSIYSYELFSCEKSVKFADLNAFEFLIDKSDSIKNSFEHDYSTEGKLQRMRCIAAQLSLESCECEKDPNPSKKDIYRSAAQHIYSRLEVVSLDRDIARIDRAEIYDEIAALRKDLVFADINFCRTNFALLATETVLEQKK